MNKVLILLLVLHVLAIPSVLSADPPQPPDHFEVFQNFPDPFCPTAEGGVTQINFMLPQQAEVLLEVWNPDTTVVVRSLVHGVLQAGYHSIIWDGTGDGGEALPPGGHPYSMTATDPDSADPLFYGVLIATIDCTVAIGPATWGAIKAGFRGE